MAAQKLKCVCGDFTSKPWAVVNKIPIVECIACGVRRVESIDPDKYTALYTSGQYHAEGSEDLPHKDAGREPHRTRFSDDYRVAHLRLAKLYRYKRPRACETTLLDVGCANGAFMAVAQESAYTVHGCDLASDAADDRIKSTIRCGDLRSVGFQRRSMDVITFNDSFEHFIDPLSA